MVVFVLTLLACGGVAAEPTRDGTGSGPLANVVDVTALGDPGAYNFAVTVKSPDKGCSQFADWWEVATPEGALVYRRILLHSHVDEQPFTRSGGPVAVQADDTVIVRAHLSTSGYGGAALRGSASGGFTAAPDIGADWAPGLANEAPLPTGCAW